jgi:hypothetical protein
MSFRRHLRRPQLPDSRRRLIHHPHPDQGQLGVDVCLCLRNQVPTRAQVPVAWCQRYR